MSKRLIGYFIGGCGVIALASFIGSLMIFPGFFLLLAIDYATGGDA